MIRTLHEDQAVCEARSASQVDRRALIFAELYGVELVPHQTAIVRSWS